MDMRSVEEDIRDTEREIDLQLDRALEGYRINSGNLEVSKKAVAQAEENYRITNQQFKQNISTNTDLLDARVFLSRARTQHINALYDLFLSISEIERVVEAPLEPIKGK
jgi:outer membrane protein TolC